MALKKSFSWMNPKLEVRKTEKYNSGVFSAAKIKKGEILGVFGGYVLTLKEESQLPRNFDTGVQITENLVLSSKNKKELVDCFNHSCEPNAGFNGQICLVAMRDILKNEEVTFDYAMALYKNKAVKSYKMRCLCGRKSCRKFITDNDWKINALQNKYDGYFQFFLQKRINSLKI